MGHGYWRGAEGQGQQLHLSPTGLLALVTLTDMNVRRTEVCFLPLLNMEAECLEVSSATLPGLICVCPGDI